MSSCQCWKLGCAFWSSLTNYRVQVISVEYKQLIVNTFANYLSQKKYCFKFCKTCSMSTVSHKRTMYKLNENLQRKVLCWANENMTTSCSKGRDVKWYWCLKGNNPPKNIYVNWLLKVKRQKHQLIWQHIF